MLGAQNTKTPIGFDFCRLAVHARRDESVVFRPCKIDSAGTFTDRSTLPRLTVGGEIAFEMRSLSL
jgi:predicted Zn-dependent protease